MSRYHHAAGLDHRDAKAIVPATLDLYGTRCALCGNDGADTSDHITPISLGGDPYALANRQPAHRLCNRRRGTMTLAEWFARNPLPVVRSSAPSRDW